MNTLLLIGFILATATASVIGPLGLIGPAAPGLLLQGPSSQTALTGPDGSIITASAQGGAVAVPPTAGGVVTAAVSPPIVAPAVIAAAPAILAAAPAVVAAPALAAPTGAIIAGPSGTVISNGLGLSEIIAPGLLVR